MIFKSDVVGGPDLSSYKAKFDVDIFGLLFLIISGMSSSKILLVKTGETCDDQGD